jgi:LemA protein
VDPENLTEESLARFNAAQGDLSNALGRLLMLTENYPDLKANQQFSDLQTQLEGTENRITTERMKFNEAAKAYNTLIRKFPDNIIASMFGFEKKGYFEAQAGAETAPKVEF